MARAKAVIVVLDFRERWWRGL